MIKTIKKLLKLISRRDKRKLVFLLFVNITGSAVGLVGIASIMPFVGLFSNPEIIYENPYISSIYHFLNFSDIETFIIFFGVGFLILFLISNAVMAFTVWYNIRFIRGVSYNLSRSLLEHYLNQSYEFFLRRNSSELVKNMFSEVMQVTNQVLRPGVELIAKGFITLSIIIFLIYVSPKVIFLMVALVWGIYGVLYYLIRKKISRAGRERVRANKIRFSFANESFGGIKDVKLRAKEDFYLNNFSVSAMEYETAYAKIDVFSKLPKYLLESIVFGGMLALILILFIVTGDIQQVMPLIAVYVFAGYRLMPSVEVMFKSFTQIMGNKPSLNLIYNEVFKYPVSESNILTDKPLNEMPFKNSLELKDIVFYYWEMEKPVINGVNLEIKANSTVGFAGPTGCGKTTIVDIILGLLKPQQGTISVDGTILTTENIKTWQQKLGYVPQQIYLSDDTITKNIAFGVAEENIDIDAVKRAAGIANLDHFIENELPKGYNTVVGERGVRLSGGQRQRVGIARALYHDPDVLVFDEATSALDNLTEKAVMEAIDNIMGTKTIIIIAHRLTTVKKCDVIYYMEHGEIKSRGSFNELVDSNEKFRKAAGD